MNTIGCKMKALFLTYSGGVIIIYEGGAGKYLVR